MKKQFMCFKASVYKSTFASVLLIGLFLTTSLSAQSQVSFENPTNKTALIKHVGTIEDKVFIQVQFDNDSGEKFSLGIQDQDGNTLFREVYQDKKFDKRFQFDKLTDDVSKLIFTIRPLKNNYAQVFEINTNTRIIEDVVVTKL